MNTTAVQDEDHSIKMECVADAQYVLTDFRLFRFDSDIILISFHFASDNNNVTRCNVLR